MALFIQFITRARVLFSPRRQKNDDIVSLAEALKAKALGSLLFSQFACVDTTVWLRFADRHKFGASQVSPLFGIGLSCAVFNTIAKMTSAQSLLP
jgi:hypothetical protein